MTTKKLFVDTSDLDIDSTIKIFSLSDIHGDIDALIIALRDCAKVIEPISKIPSVSNNIRDPDLDILLNLDLSDLSNMRLFDEAIVKDEEVLGFKWIGKNAHVVLVGDTIDPIRKNSNGALLTPSLRGKRNVNDLYPQAEIKILKFLNRLDILANSNDGRVIKLIGNHELANFIPNKPYTSQYYGDIYTHDGREPMPYINSITGMLETLPRNNFFNLNNPGFHLFMERGSGVFLRINNILFMHGQIYNNKTSTFNYNKCTDFNKTLNNPLLINLDSVKDFKSSPQLWDRDYGNDELIDKRMSVIDDKFCKSVVDDINNFLKGHPKQSETFKIVIGHCPQMNSTWFTETNRTFITKSSPDTITVELTQPAETFKSRFVSNDVFGISMECPMHIDQGKTINDSSDQHHRIYKVDVGVSRGFDQDNIYNISTNYNMKKFFLSRVPQVLVMENDDVRIIRSTVQNTRIHQYREKLEQLITNPDLSIDNISFGGYKQKYLKYKQKYLQIKQKLNIS